MMEKTKVTRNYRVTIPLALREKVGLKIGDVLIADVEDERIVLSKRHGDFTKMKLKLGRKFDWRDVESAAAFDKSLRN